MLLLLATSMILAISGDSEHLFVFFQFSPPNLIFCDLKPDAKLQNHRTTRFGRKVTQAERKKRDICGNLVPCRASRDDGV
jgi:hypothetical protein